MTTAPPPRRVSALLAAGVLGLGTAVLASPVVAHAAPSGWGFDTTSPEFVTVPDGTCGVQWTVIGASGPGAPGTERRVSTSVQAGEVFWLLPGSLSDTDGGDTAVNRAQTNYLVALGGGTGTDLVENGGAQIIPDAGRDFSGPTSTDSTSGRISGQGIACEVPPGGTQPPGAPVQVQAASSGAGAFAVYFDPAPTTGESATVTGYEYRLDGGAWHSATTQPGGFLARQFTVTGLVPARQYSMDLRAVSTAGPGPASAAVPVRAGAARLGAPTAVSVEEAPARLTVTWSPPVPTDSSYPLAAYDVSILGVNLPEPIKACRTGADARTCTVRVPPGHVYTVVVDPVDSAGLIGQPAYAASDLVPGVPAPPVPATVPAKDDDLRGASDQPIDRVTAGRTVVLRGSGFAPYSTVRAVAYSTPTELRTFVTDATGSFEVTVTIPADLAPGDHSLVVTGVDEHGAARNLRVDVTVSAAGAATVASAAVAPAGAARLADTGADIAGPVVGGMLAVVSGTGLLLSSRRRPLSSVATE